ncbi:MAG: PadR family transcriptional regulator [Acidobacteriota bacterium]
MNHSDFYILLALSEGERHGYAIMQEVAEHSGGEIRLGPGTLYGAIKRLLAAGYIEETDERPDPELDDSRRRYYHLSGSGRKAVAAEAERLASLVRLAQSRRILDKKALVIETGGQS